MEGGHRHPAWGWEGERWFVENIFIQIVASGDGIPRQSWPVLFFHPNRSSSHQHAITGISSQGPCYMATRPLPGLFTVNWLKKGWAQTRRPGRLCSRGRVKLKRRKGRKPSPCLGLSMRRSCWGFCFTWETTSSTPNTTSPAASRPGLRGTEPLMWILNYDWHFCRHSSRDGW